MTRTDIVGWDRLMKLGMKFAGMGWDGYEPCSLWWTLLRTYCRWCWLCLICRLENSFLDILEYEDLDPDKPNVLKKYVRLMLLF